MAIPFLEIQNALAKAKIRKTLRGADTATAAASVAESLGKRTASQIAETGRSDAALASEKSKAATSTIDIPNFTMPKESFGVGKFLAVAAGVKYRPGGKPISSLDPTYGAKKKVTGVTDEQTLKTPVNAIKQGDWEASGKEVKQYTYAKKNPIKEISTEEDPLLEEDLAVLPESMPTLSEAEDDVEKSTAAGKIIGNVKELDEAEEEDDNKEVVKIHEEIDKRLHDLVGKEGLREEEKADLRPKTLIKEGELKMAIKRGIERTLEKENE